MKILKYNSYDWQNLSRERQEEIITKDYDLYELYFRNTNNPFHVLKIDFIKTGDINIFKIEIVYCIFINNISSWFVSSLKDKIFIDNPEEISNKNSSFFRRDIGDRLLRKIFTNL